MIRSTRLSGGFVAVLLLLQLLPTSGFSQNILTIGNGSGFPGSSTNVPVVIGHDDPVLGFSYGATHDGAVLSPISISQGSALLPLNGGTGAEYFFSDLVPANGPGMILACIFTFGGALDTLPPGQGQEVAVMEYSISPSATPGSSTAVDPSTALGSPPTNIVFTVVGSSIFPSSAGGSVAIDVPAPTGVTTTMTDICSCAFDVSWTNGTSYDSVEVRVGGVVVSTLPGTATSSSVTLPQAATDVCISGVIGTTSSAQSCLTDECPVYIPPAPPGDFTCTLTSADPVSGCVVDLTWTNPGGYASFNLHINGAIEVVEATATSWQGPLALSPDPQTLCLEAIDECGGALAMVCCDVTCTAGPQFIRGDCNADGGPNNIADVVAALSFLFAGAGPPPCGDSCDINDDGGFDISDAVFLLSNLFSSGAFPPAPYPDCGEDPTDTDPIDCASFPPCP